MKKFEPRTSYCHYFIRSALLGGTLKRGDISPSDEVSSDPDTNPESYPEEF